MAKETTQLPMVIWEGRLPTVLLAIALLTVKILRAFISPTQTVLAVVSDDVIDGEAITFWPLGAKIMIENIAINVEYLKMFFIYKK